MARERLGSYSGHETEAPPERRSLPDDDRRDRPTPPDPIIEQPRWVRRMKVSERELHAEMKRERAEARKHVVPSVRLAIAEDQVDDLRAHAVHTDGDNADIEAELASQARELDTLRGRLVRVERKLGRRGVVAASSAGGGIISGAVVLKALEWLNAHVLHWVTP